MTFKIILCVGLLFILPLEGQTQRKVNLGGFSISKDLFLYISKVLEQGKTILELGSGFGTGELAKYYKMYSIEHNQEWLHKYNSTYIYAPIKDYKTYSWYDVTALNRYLPQKYDMILIDGPTGVIGRYGFFENLHLFNPEVLMIFDDVQREPELRLLKDVARKLNKSFAIYKCSDRKLFGVINEPTR